jgi:hypothetical protein
MYTVYNTAGGRQKWHGTKPAVKKTPQDVALPGNIPGKKVEREKYQ